MFNLRTPVCKKETNQTKQRKSNGERKQLRFTNMDLSQILQKQKLVLVDYSERGLRDETLGA